MRAFPWFAVAVLAICTHIAAQDATPAARSGAQRERKPAASARQRTASAKTDAASKTETGSKADDDAKADTSAKTESTTISKLVAESDTKAAAPADKVALLVHLTGTMRERGATFSVLSTKSDSLKDCLDTLRRARQDPAVKTVVLHISALEVGLATAQEIRDAVAELRASSRRVIAILDDDSQPSYLIAASAEEIVMPPSGDLMLLGAKIDAYFLKPLLSKLGVKADILAMGKYKSAGEALNEDDFTSASRENMEEIVGDVFGILVQTVADSRKLSRPQVEALVDKGMLSATEAREAKLVDRVAYSDDVLRDLKTQGMRLEESAKYFKDARAGEEGGLLGLLSAISARGSDSKAHKSKLPQVAVLYAVGPITLGESGSVLGNDEEVSSEDFIETLADIQNDDKIKAVILRINSPGGSAFASDLIWQKLGEVRRRKPVIASMGDTAASGGYYIAMGATRVVAHSGTLTGSIGVVGGKLDLSGGLKKIGLNKSTVAKGKFAELFSETGGFTAPQRELVLRTMKRTYDDFVAKAAEGRRKPVADIEKVAQGRVWMGGRAKDAGLVDELGGFPVAIREAKLLIGLTADDKIELVPYPKELSMVELLQKLMGSNAQVRVLPAMMEGLGLPMALAPVVEHAAAVSRMLGREHVLAVMPFVPVMN